MKIGNAADKPALAPATTPARSGSASAPSAGVSSEVPAAGAEASAKVEISSAASRLISGVGASTPEFDAEKVQRIAKAIAEGKFTVNHAAIADKLIANAQELLGKTSH